MTSDTANDASRVTHHESPLNSQPSTLNPLRAFTLIELLVVIAIMATLAALLLPVIRGVKRRQYISHAQAELAQLETAIDRYKAAYGFYPPDNHVTPPAPSVYPMINQLYYELVGTTNADVSSPSYHPLDGLGLDLKASDVQSALGVGGFMNQTKPGGGEDASVAKDFLPNLKPNQIGVVTNTTTAPTVGVTVLVCAVGGPDDIYRPMGAVGLNPWRYNSSNPTNNPGSYELWILLSISGQTNLICNWSKQVQVVTNGWIH